MKDTDLAYAAGFIEGDGSITIHRRRPCGEHRNIIHTLVLIATNTDKRVLDWFKEEFGGYVYLSHKPHRNKPHWRPRSSWRIASSSAEEVLKQILPYLKIKREQALLGLEFQKRKKCGGKRLSEQEIQERNKLYEKMHALHNFRNSINSPN